MRVFFIAFIISVCPCAGMAQGYGFTGDEYHNFSPETLAKTLTQHLHTDRQKVEAIFKWITDNIDYKIKSPLHNRRPLYYSKDLDTGILKPLNERVSEKVLEDREAFCEGYARLFTTLCTYAGIRSEVVTGYVRNNTGRPATTFRSNHSWNAVNIENNWHLLDVTWASGYITIAGNRFIRHYDDYYFLTPPAQLIRTHYPEDLQWTLLEDPPALKEFETSPFKLTGFYTRHIQRFFPSWGVLDAAPGDTIRFELHVPGPTTDVRVIDEASVDSLPLSQVQWWHYPATPATIAGDKITFHYVINNPATQWLHIVYNNAVVLRYRVNTKSR